jgi:hypothetical protein
MSVKDVSGIELCQIETHLQLGPRPILHKTLLYDQGTWGWLNSSMSLREHGARSPVLIECDMQRR